MPPARDPMSFGLFTDELEQLDHVKAKFIELWATYPDRTPNEVGEAAFKLCGEDPGFRFAQYAAQWSTDLEVLEQRDARRPLGRNADARIPTKEELIAEQLEIARDPRVDAKDRNTAYRNAMEALGHITKQVAKTSEDKTKRMPTIVFKRYEEEAPAQAEAARA